MSRFAPYAPTSDFNHFPNYTPGHKEKEKLRTHTSNCCEEAEYLNQKGFIWSKPQDKRYNKS